MRRGTISVVAFPGAIDYTVNKELEGLSPLQVRSFSGGKFVSPQIAGPFFGPIFLQINEM